MMRKYFPLEASERLFVAIEEDDVVDAQVSLPPTIALSCTTEIIHDNYALCLQFWLKRRTKNAKTFHDKCENFTFRASNETAAFTAVFLFIKWDHFGYG